MIVIETKKASLEDLDSICHIDNMVIGNQSRKNDFIKSIENNECVITSINGIIVGFAICDRTFFGCSFISLVIVNPQFRRQGVAKGLLAYIEKNSLTEKLFTSTNESNITMQKVCDSLGFIRSGLIENLDDGDPELIYFKQVKPISQV